MNSSEKFWEEFIEPGYYDNLYYKALSKNYGLQNAWEYYTVEHILDCLEKNNNSHLDYACGPGTLLNLINSNLKVGIDISQKQINFAKKKYGNLNKFLHVDNRDQLVTSEVKFDTITCIGLFEFLNEEEINNLLDYFFQLMHDNSTLIITTPKFSLTFNIILRISNLFRKFNYKSIHINKTDNQLLVKQFEKTKFQVVELRNIFTPAIFLSLFYIKFSFKIEKFLNRIFSYKFGFIQLAIIKTK